MNERMPVAYMDNQEGISVCVGVAALFACKMRMRSQARDRPSSRLSCILSLMQNLSVAHHCWHRQLVGGG